MFLFLMRTAWRYAGEARPRMVLYFILFMCANITIAFQPLALAKIINTIQAGGLDAIPQAVQWAGVYAALMFGFWALHGPARVLERRAAYTAYNHFTTALYKMVAEMPLRWHQDHHSGDTINRINKGSRALFLFMQEIFIAIQMTVRFSMCMIVLGTYSVWVLVVSFTSSLIIATLIRRFDRVLVPLVEKRNGMEHRLNATLFDYISNIVTVLTLRLQNDTRAEIGHKIGEMKPTFWREVLVNEWKWGTVQLLLIVTQTGIIGGYVAFSEGGVSGFAVGTLVAIFQYLIMVNQVFYDAANMYERTMYRHTDLRGVDELIADHKRLAKVAGATDSYRWKEIGIKGLSFTHHEGEDVLHHLRDADLTIRPGQKIAFVGTSGSGKTTLLTLLRGLYEAQKVDLTLDGERYRDLLPLSGFTTLVPQDSEIFENTILYNLTMGTDVPDKVVEQALHVTTFGEVADKLPNKLLTDIREKGVNLSGGQKQRLALTRGLIAARDSSLLLLDEPTSSMDLPTESVIFDRLFAAFSGKAIIASIHRLHLLPRFDTICLMQDGVIVEQGSFQQLLAKRGAFHELWEHHLAQSARGDQSGELI